MKFGILFLICLFGFNSWSVELLNWNDLEVDGKYHLGQEIIFEKEQISIPQGSPLLLNDVIGGELPVLLLTFKNLLCTNEELQTEMVLHLLDPNDRDSAIGVVLETGCTVNMYVEPRHYFGKSPFLKGSY